MMTTILHCYTMTSFVHLVNAGEDDVFLNKYKTRDVKPVPGLMLDLRRRRWVTIKPELDQRLVFLWSIHSTETSHQ